MNNSLLPPALVLADFPAKCYKPFPLSKLFLHPYNSKLKLTAVLKAFFDESGSDDTPALLIAGYVSTESRWERFERRWTEVLESEGIQRGFHMLDFETGSGEFRGPLWTPERKDHLFRQLAEIIGREAMFEVAAGVSISDFKAVSSRVGKRFRANIKTPYALCVLLCITHITLWARKRWRNEEVALVFDQGRKFTGEILQWYKQAASWGKLREFHKVKSIGVARKEEQLALQAADILAHLGFRAYKSSDSRGFIDPVTEKRLLALHHVKRAGGFLDRKDIEYWLKPLSSDLFIKLFKNR